MKTRRWLPVLTVGLTLAASAMTQESPRGQSSPMQALMDRFEANAPAVGDRLPEVSAYDARGNAIALDEILGESYTVLVLGCLT